MIDGVRGGAAQLGHTAVARQPRGVAHQFAEAGVIGMLIVHKRRGKHDARPHAPQDAGELDGMGSADFEMGIAVEFDEFDRGAEQGRGASGFDVRLLGRAVAARFAARADDEMGGPAGARFVGDHAAAPELDVVRVGAEGQRAARAQLGRSV